MKTADVRKVMITPQWGDFIQLAAQEVFNLMLNADLAPVGGVCAERPEITAVVGLAGQICGVFSVGCSSEAAVQMTTAMLGLKLEAGNPETWDAVGEVCNMIAGNFKSKLQGTGDGCMLSVPTVVTGFDYAVRSLARGERLEKVLQFHGETIWIALDIEG